MTGTQFDFLTNRVFSLTLSSPAIKLFRYGADKFAMSPSRVLFILILPMTACTGFNSEVPNTSSTSSSSNGAISYAQQAYVKPSVLSGGDAFGSTLAISGDTMVVGAYLEDSSASGIINGTTGSTDGSMEDSGAVYVYVRSGSTWVQQAYIKSPNPDIYDSFGSAVAISGDTIIVGAPGEDSNLATITNGSTASADNSLENSGAVFIFKRTGTTWAQEAFIKAPNAGDGDQFGFSVAISGETVVVGAPFENSNDTAVTNGSTGSSDNSALDAGAAYVFVRTGVNWSAESFLKASNTDPVDLFGRSVAIDGDTIVVGAPQEDGSLIGATTAGGDLDNSISRSGAAYVFKRTGVNWAEESYLKPPNTYYSNYFGWSVSVSGDLAAVSAPWEGSNQATITNGSTASTNTSKSGAGAVYIFSRTGAIWFNEAYIKPTNPDASDNFGISISLDDDTLAVGANREASNSTAILMSGSSSSNNDLSNAGAAYVFRKTSSLWGQEAYIKAVNVDASDSFGNSVSVSSGTIVVGAPGEDSNQVTITNGTTASSDDSASSSGAAYVYLRTDPP